MKLWIPLAFGGILIASVSVEASRKAIDLEGEPRRAIMDMYYGHRAVWKRINRYGAYVK